MLVVARTKLAIMSRPLMPCLFANVNLHHIFLFNHFKGWMLFTNLHFFSLFNMLVCLYVGVNDQLQYLLVHYLGVLFSIALPLCSNLNLLCTS